MGIVNVTPDSFSDGGRFMAPENAISHGRQLLEEGADLIDLGAESTRPGSQPVPADEQVKRLAPVVEALASIGAVLSIDTQSAVVAHAMLGRGAHLINDISALGDPDMAAVVAQHGAGLVLMHMQGTPATMQLAPHYRDVVDEVAAFLAQRSAKARAAGIADECIVLDPGIGFGKTLEHNLALLGSLTTLVRLGHPVLVGVSRKGFLGRLTGEDSPQQRFEASLAAGVLAAWQGVHLLRVHDVAATRRALALSDAVTQQRASAKVEPR